MKGKVLIVASMASMIANFNIENIMLLKKMGYQVDIAANFGSEDPISKDKREKFILFLEREEVKYYDIAFPKGIGTMKKNISVYKKLDEICKNNNYELIHTNSPLASVIARLVARKNKIKLIYTAHGFHFHKDAPLKNWIIYYPIEKVMSKFTDVLITLNSEDYNISKRKFYASKTVLIPGVGIDLSKFDIQTEEKKKLLRSEYGYENDEFILFYAAELNSNKNQDLLIDVVYELKNEVPMIKLLLAGEGDYKCKYQEKIVKLGLEKNIEILGYRSDIKNLLLISDIVVASSKREGLPVNLMEAMATGIPIVASDNRGHRELIINGKNGLLIPLNNLQLFVDAVLDLCRDNKIAKDMKNQGILDVRKYSQENVTKKIEEIYTTLF